MSDDEILQSGVLPALREYNLAQFITADVPGHQHQVSSSIANVSVVVIDVLSNVFDMK